MPPAPSFAEATRAWLKIGLLSFGGPAGQIAVMHRIVVEEKRWVAEEHFLRALNYCMLLPGPEAQQLATYLGWLLHGTKGGLVAGWLFVLPGALFMALLSAIYAAFHKVPLVEGVFYGVKAAVVAIVAQALLRIGGRALRRGPGRLLAAVSLLVLFFDALPFPAVVLGAALIGAAWPRVFGKEQAEAPGPAARPSLGRAVRLALAGLALWWAPVIALALWLGADHLQVRLGLFFSEAAMVTFGGAYALLAFLAQHVVQDQGWLSAGQMMDGLGLAETTPGPLILVVQFVAFMAAFQQPEPFGPWGAAALASLIVVWVTFVPSFLWIFLGAPYIEALRGARRIEAALGAITAAVVGVIANLSLWFALHVIFREVRVLSTGPFTVHVPAPASVDLVALGLTVAAIVATFRYKLGMAPLLAGAAIAGALARLSGVI